MTIINTIDHLIIAVEDLEAAEGDYEKVLGVGSVWRGTHKELGTSNVIFNFENTYLELLAATGHGSGADLVRKRIDQKGEGLFGLVLGSNDLQALRKKVQGLGYNLPRITAGEGVNSETGHKRSWLNQFLPPSLTRGIFSFIIEHKIGFLSDNKGDQDEQVHRLDHVVIRTPHLDDFIKIYRDIFGIRLALDTVVQSLKKRVLFFRLNSTTIEVVESSGGKGVENDCLWGMAWAVSDIRKITSRLAKQGVEVSEIKKGAKKNTLVATVKSHTHAVPTLLIEHT